jgi:transcriptional regulator with XRE-family HTH domain
VIGQRVRELRERAGVRQEDLADNARALELPWNRSRIAALERGEKSISVEDLVLLVALLGTALNRPVDVAELFDIDESIRLSKAAEISARQLAEVLRGGDPGDKVILGGGLPDIAIDVEAFERTRSRRMAVEQLAGTSPSIGDLRAIKHSMGEADERARRTLGEVVGVYITICHALWGRSLSAERDARLQSTKVSPASLAARRGRVTRGLLAEARQFQDKINGSGGLTDGQHPEAR